MYRPEGLKEFEQRWFRTSGRSELIDGFIPEEYHQDPPKTGDTLYGVPIEVIPEEQGMTAEEKLKELYIVGLWASHPITLPLGDAPVSEPRQGKLSATYSDTPPLKHHADATYHIPSQ